LAENGNECTMYAYFSSTPGFFARFYLVHISAPALSAIQMRMMVA